MNWMYAVLCIYHCGPERTTVICLRDFGNGKSLTKDRLSLEVGSKRVRDSVTS